MKSPKSLKLPSKPNVKVRLYLREIRGDSMLPTFSEGQLVVFVSRRNFQVGDVVMFRHTGIEKIKRIARLEDGRLYLLGDNPSASTDSRQFGWVGQEDIVGVLLWPKRQPTIQ